MRRKDRVKRKTQKVRERGRAEGGEERRTEEGGRVGGLGGENDRVLERLIGG